MKKSEINFTKVECILKSCSHLDIVFKIFVFLPKKKKKCFFNFQNDDIVDRPSYQALVDPLQSDESSESKQESIAALPSQQHKEHHGNNVGQNSIPQSQLFESQSTPIQIKLPLQLDFDEIAGVSIVYLFHSKA